MATGHGSHGASRGVPPVDRQIFPTPSGHPAFLISHDLSSKICTILPQRFTIDLPGNTAEPNARYGELSTGASHSVV